MSDVLISPLGRSPGAVSGVYYALRARNFPIQRVIAVGTSNDDVVIASESYLKPLFKGKIAYEAIHLPDGELRSGKRSVMPYASMTGLAVQNARRDPQVEHIHVAVTGGRSGMGALAALAAQLYNADYLWHLWVAPDIERDGILDQLKYAVSDSQLESSELLNPTLLGKEAWDLVELPLTHFNLDGLGPRLTALWQAQSLDLPQSWAEQPPDAEQPSDAASPPAPWVSDFDLKQLFDIFPPGMTFALAKELLGYLQELRRDPDPARHDQLLMDIGALLQSAGVIEHSERSDLINKLHFASSWEDLFAYDWRDRPGAWRWLKENAEPLQAGAELAQAFLAGLLVWAQFAGRLP